MPRIKVAIACQGGGSQTAFTAGALKALIEAGAGKDFEPSASAAPPVAQCARLWPGTRSVWASSRDGDG